VPASGPLVMAIPAFESRRGPRRRKDKFGKHRWVRAWFTGYRCLTLRYAWRGGRFWRNRHILSLVVGSVTR
jgi:hypothetical protein